MKNLKLGLISVMAIVGVAFATPLLVVSTVGAEGPADAIGEGAKKVGGDNAGMSLEDGIKNVVNVLLFLLGAIAVIMIIIGGIRYATSNGDSGAIKGAKDTILYAVIGLIVAILAYAIVNFVVGAFAK
ncbi:TPA: hypothetical protein DDX46_00200 [Candidatus Saccharibacteria bacterium]|nr:MAG: membrane protein of unknown function [Candidatus Saccharibacteria bacterium GW2011_GWC2_44_17]OGL33617.1 MAG: hypothetical protein A3E20_02590 [Candidatus Saccharibacteria bacterium RIFCSPHIGHO2_12_FULL_47_16]HBH77154.1 hypothetical protein [Candidatus Saccharibacteria bacterium]